MLKIIKILCIAIILLMSNLAMSSDFKILYIVDYKTPITEDDKKDFSENLDQINLKMKETIENSINDSISIKSAIINVNLDVVDRNTPYATYETSEEGDSGSRINAISDTKDIFLPIFKNLDTETKDFIKSNDGFSKNDLEYNNFINELYTKTKYFNPDLIVIMVDDLNVLYSQGIGITGSMMSYNSSFEEQINTNDPLNKDFVRKIRNEKLETKFISVRKVYDGGLDGLDWVIMHEMGHTFSLYHDPMTIYSNNFIITNDNDFGYVKTSHQKDFSTNPIKDFLFRDNDNYGYYHPEGKGLLYSQGNTEYYSIMAYASMGKNYLNGKQKSLNIFTDSVRLRKELNIHQEYDTVPFDRYLNEENPQNTNPDNPSEPKYYNEYTSMKVDTSSNTASIVQKYLIELTNDSLPSVIDEKIEKYPYEIRRLKELNDEIVIDKIIENSSQNIIHTSLLDNTYILGSDNVVYLSTGNDTYEIDDTVGNIFIVEENEIQDLMELSLEEKSKTTLNNFNSKTKLIAPVGANSGGYASTVCVKIPSYDEYNKINKLFGKNDYEILLDEYGNLLCPDKESNSNAFIISFIYNTKTLDIELSQENGAIGKLLFNTHTENIYRDNNPLGNPQLLKPDLKNYYYYEFTISPNEERFSDTIDENDDNDNKIISTIPSTSGSDEVVGTNGNDIMGNPDFESDEWVNHDFAGDTYEPKGGNDFIYGSPYSDTYIFEGDFGTNTIYDRADVSKFSMGAFNDFDQIHLIGFTVDDVIFERHQFDLVIISKLKEKNMIIVEDFFKVIDITFPYQYEANQIEIFKFFLNKNDANPVILTAIDIIDQVNNVDNNYAENILWGNIDTSNTFQPTEGKTIYVGGLKKDKYILDINSKEIITIRDRGGEDTLFIKTQNEDLIFNINTGSFQIDLPRLNFVRNGNDLNVYYKYKKLAIIEDNFLEEVYGERNIEYVERIDLLLDLPEGMNNFNLLTIDDMYKKENPIKNKIRSHGFITLVEGYINQKLEDVGEVFENYNKIEYYKPGIGDDVFEEIKGEMSSF